jgi:CRP-like cAMP-binding protein
MIERYQGKDGRVALLDVMRAQFLVEGNTEIADMMASAALLKEFTPGTVLFNDGDRGGELFLILCGQVSVRKRDQEIDKVDAGIHVGEIGLMEPFKGRSASVVAVDTVVVAQITDESEYLCERLRCRLVHGGGRRLRRTTDAVGKSCTCYTRSVKRWPNMIAN